LQADRLLAVATLKNLIFLAGNVALHNKKIEPSVIKIQLYVWMRGIDFLDARHKIVAIQQFPVESIF
jgi:hypothetical protein